VPERCWRYDWIVDLDIKGFFDNIDHALMMHAVRKHTDSPWILLYIERWLKAPAEAEDGTPIARDRGTPQGGVISPLLANIFLHHVFDMWMSREHPGCPFERYADDVVIHCRSYEEALAVKSAVEARLRQCKLEAHPKRHASCTAGTATDERTMNISSSTFWVTAFDPERPKTDGVSGSPVSFRASARRRTKPSRQKCGSGTFTG
jgi:RNA-directed DNA polymerase